MSLKTDYKDYILDTMKNTTRKFNMINNPDGTVSFEDVSEYSQTGDSFGANDINNITKAIETNTKNISQQSEAIEELKENGTGGSGTDGKDGFSPIATVTQTDTGATISIQDKNGTTTATITNGKDGKDGADGKNGADGYTPIKGTDYFDGKDGYTPVKGVDYFDGEKGEKGDTGATGAKGDTGEKGQDGTSVTISNVSESTVDGGSNVVTFSDGKTLTIKNGSKGSQGEKGETGASGKDGSDYVLTDSDKQEIAETAKEKVLLSIQNEAIILTESELSALTQEELKEKYEKGVRFIIVSDDENLVPTAISANGAIYNGCGFMNGYRLNSSGTIVASDMATVTGFIPFIYGKTIEITGGLNNADNGGQYIATYNEVFELIGVNYLSALINNSSGSSICTDENIYIHTIDTSAFTATDNINMFSSATYIRVSICPCIGGELTIRYID